MPGIRFFLINYHTNWNWVFIWGITNNNADYRVFYPNIHYFEIHVENVEKLYTLLDNWWVCSLGFIYYLLQLDWQTSIIIVTCVIGVIQEIRCRIWMCKLMTGCLNLWFYKLIIELIEIEYSYMANFHVHITILKQWHLSISPGRHRKHSSPYIVL